MSDFKFVNVRFEQKYQEQIVQNKVNFQVFQIYTSIEKKIIAY